LAIIAAGTAAVWTAYKLLRHNRRRAKTWASDPLPRRPLPAHLRRLSGMPGHPERVRDWPGYADAWHQLVVQLAVEVYQQQQDGGERP
jgi:hypothetical protein